MDQGTRRWFGHVEKRFPRRVNDSDVSGTRSGRPNRI